MSVGSSLILQNSDPHPEVSPNSPRFLFTKSSCPLLQIPSADSEELLGRLGKSCLGASRRKWRLPEMLRAGHGVVPDQELNGSATSLEFHLVLLFSRGFQLPSAFPNLSTLPNHTQNTSEAGNQHYPGLHSPRSGLA